MEQLEIRDTFMITMEQLEDGRWKASAPYVDGGCEWFIRPTAEMAATRVLRAILNEKLPE